MDFRPLTEEDYPKQREVFGLSFPETIGTPVIERPFYEWKFRSVPASPPSYEYVCLEGEQMLGYYAALPMRYKVGDQTLKAGLVLDVMTHPAARGKGVFVKTGSYALDQMKDAGIAFTTGYPIRPEVLPGHIKVGWKVAFELPMYLRVLRANSILAGRAPAFLAAFVNPFLSAFTMASRLWRGRSGGVTVMPLEAFLASDAVWEFYERFHQAHEIVWLRDRAALSWRLGRPDAQYLTLVEQDASGAVQGVLIARPTELKGVTTLGILDVATLGSSSALLLAAEVEASKRNLDSLCMMVSNTTAKRLRLGKHAYLKTPFRFKLIVKPLSDETLWGKLLDETAWHLGWIDSDDL